MNMKKIIAVVLATLTLSNASFAETKSYTFVDANMNKSEHGVSVVRLDSGSQVFAYTYNGKVVRVLGNSKGYNESQLTRAFKAAMVLGGTGAAAWVLAGGLYEASKTAALGTKIIVRAVAAGIIFVGSVFAYEQSKAVYYEVSDKDVIGAILSPEVSKATGERVVLPNDPIKTIKNLETVLNCTP